MNAGKTTTLLQIKHNYRERGLKTLLFVPAIGNQAKQGIVHSRVGLRSSAIPANKDFDFFAYVEREMGDGREAVKAVLIDEAQFLSKAQVVQLTDIVDRLGVSVLAYGLRSDFQGVLFEGSRYLLTWAEELNEMRTICHCGKKAIMTMRVDREGNKLLEGPQVQVGGNEAYVPTCRKHHKEGKVMLIKTPL